MGEQALVGEAGHVQMTLSFARALLLQYGFLTSLVSTSLSSLFFVRFASPPSIKLAHAWQIRRDVIRLVIDHEFLTSLLFLRRDLHKVGDHGFLTSLVST